MLDPKKFWAQKKLWVQKIWCPKKVWLQKMLGSIGKHLLYATIRFLVCSVIVDLGAVLLVLLVLLMTLAIWTPDPQSSAKSPRVVCVSNFSLLVHPILIDFGEGFLLFFLL